jgi:hypothetical protein
MFPSRRKSFGSWVRRRHARPLTNRPNLERLEDRLVPSVASPTPDQEKNFLAQAYLLLLDRPIDSTSQTTNLAAFAQGSSHAR